MLNQFFIQFGIEAWKPVLTALALPPVPLLLLLLVGARLLWTRRAAGWAVVWLSVVLLWLSTCTGVAGLLSSRLLHAPAALSPARINALRLHAGTGLATKLTATTSTNTAIVVLGGGVEGFAAEYGAANLEYASLERLRYGIWLGRQTGLPVAFSGGVGWAQVASDAEAYIASRIAADEFKRPLVWAEGRSRDTHENAVNSVALLKRSGVQHIVLVTHAWHMPRALRAFTAATAQAAGKATPISIEVAPIGQTSDHDVPVLHWLPSRNGTVQVRQILRELGGLLAGA